MAMADAQDRGQVMAFKPEPTSPTAFFDSVKNVVRKSVSGRMSRTQLEELNVALSRNKFGEAKAVADHQDGTLSVVWMQKDCEVTP